MCFTSHFVNVFPEKIDNRKTSPVSRVHTNTAKQYTPESTGGPWKHPFLHRRSVETPLPVPGFALKASSVAFAMGKWTTVFIIVLLITTFG